MKLFFILLFSITLQAQSISEIWESSSEHKEFTALLESGKVQQALQLKLNAINAITKEELHSYFLAFKPKYRQKYVQRYCEFPLGVREITVTLYAIIEPSLKNATQKEKNKVAKAIYDFFSHYTKEDGKALKYAKKLQKTLPKNAQNSKVLEAIFAMAKESDIEAAKTPQQKQKEHEAFIEALDKRIEAENKKQKELRRSIEKWDKMIKQLQAI
jgi:hypothetical protein